MQNSMMLFIFSIFEWKYPFRANLVQKIKIVTLSWNLVSTLTRTCRIQWWCSFFFVFDRKYPFWANLVRKIKIVTLSWNLVPTLSRTCRIQWWCSLFSFLTGSALLGQIWSKLSIFTVFFASDQKCSFLGKFGPKCQSCQFKAKFASYNLLQNIFGI